MLRGDRSFSYSGTACADYFLAAGGWFSRVVNGCALAAIAPRPPIAVPASDAPAPTSNAPPMHPATSRSEEQRSGCGNDTTGDRAEDAPADQVAGGAEESADRRGEGDVVLDVCGGGRQVDLLEWKTDRGGGGGAGVGSEGCGVSVDLGGDRVADTVDRDRQRHRVDEYSCGVTCYEVIVLVAQRTGCGIDDDLVPAAGDVPSDTGGGGGIGVGGAGHDAHRRDGHNRDSHQLGHLPA